MRTLPRELEQWARGRRTSEPVAEAIWWLAETPDEAQRIWEEPTPGEWLAVYERATRNGLIEELQWGEETLYSVK